MSVVLAFVAGLVASVVLWQAMSPEFHESEVLRRENYRGHRLPVAAGVVIVLAAVLVGATYSVFIRLGADAPDEQTRLADLLALSGTTLGYGLLGLLDDLVGATSTKGFRGHLGALAHGRVTTGLVKLVWGVLLGVLAAPGTGWGGLRGGLVIAAMANVGNLFDRAPGRTIKVSLLGGVLVLVLMGALDVPVGEVSAMALVLGAGLGMLVPDLRERCMLGDTGSNVLGAAVGFGLVVALGPTGEWIALAALVALNLASERISFTRVIDATPPLRWCDRLGSLPERRRPG